MLELNHRQRGGLYGEQGINDKPNNVVNSGLFAGILAGEDKHYNTFSSLGVENVREEQTMRCYDCAKLGKDTETVTVCVVCGKALCMEHSLRENMPMVDIIDWGFGKEEHRYPVDIPKFICAECKNAIDVRRKGK